MKLTSSFSRILSALLLSLPGALLMGQQSGNILPVNAALSGYSVAILPVRFGGDGSDAKMKEMPFHLQELAVDYMARSAKPLTVQDPLQTNAVLFDNGITMDNLRERHPREIAALLHVQYVVIASVMQEYGNQRTVSHSEKAVKETRGPGKYDDRKKTTQYNQGSINAIQDYETDVSISIYDYSGERIYAKSRQSILSDHDAYKAALHYLIKRTPLYSK